MSDILDGNPKIGELASQDLLRGRDGDRGAPGLSGEQVVRAAIIKQMNEFSYEELAFHLDDSVSYRWFCQMGLGEPGPKASTLHANISQLSEQTWEAINHRLVRDACSRKVESGKKVRIDCTVTASNIHEPWDSRQLWDTIRVVTRLMRRARGLGASFRFHDRTRCGKRRTMGVLNARRKTKRKSAYRRLVKVAEQVLTMAEEAIDALATGHGLAKELRHFVDLGWRVVDQTRRRVVGGESVPAGEKVVSIFEPHTDVIIKEARKFEYGHKICLSVGRSGLVTDCVVLEGNPNDKTLVSTMLDRHERQYGAWPRQVAMDGGFASRDNVAMAKRRGVLDVCFSKRRGIHLNEMVRSSSIYRRLRNFRAGVEGVISFLKRGFGLGRCTWSGRSGFKRYVMASVVSP